jgi:hypothetical protein
MHWHVLFRSQGSALDVERDKIRLAAVENGKWYSINAESRLLVGFGVDRLRAGQGDVFKQVNRVFLERLCWRSVCPRLPPELCQASGISKRLYPWAPRGGAFFAGDLLLRPGEFP